jgi:hypothetical protein
MRKRREIPAWVWWVVMFAASAGFAYWCAGCAPQAPAKVVSPAASIESARKATADSAARLTMVGRGIGVAVQSVRERLASDFLAALDAVESQLDTIADAGIVVQTEANSLAGPVVETITRAAQESRATDKALAAQTKRADTLQKQIDDGIRNALFWIALGSLVVAVLLAAAGIYLKMKLLLFGAAAFGALFAVATTLYEFWVYVVFGAAGLVLAAVGVGIYVAVRKARAATAVTANIVESVEIAKQALEPSEVDVLKNAMRVSQTETTKAVVSKIKGET